ncbi:MAG: aldose 1-epimerase, partial [Acetobacteraceae bacterium]
TFGYQNEGKRAACRTRLAGSPWEIAMNRARIVLRAAGLELELAPGTGGAIAGFRQRGFAVMREAAPDTSDVDLFACYPLVPFSNRIGRGRFTFRGRTYQLRCDVSTGGRHAIHGEGWQHAWSVAEAGGSSALLTLEHRGTEAGSWPFPFRAEQRFTLSGSGLTVMLALTNKAETAAPAGIGLHPYFPRHDGVILTFRARAVWHNGGDHLPSTTTALPPEWDFSASRTLKEPGLDNCFAGWPGVAEIAWPAAGRTLKIEADRCFGHAVVYTPPSSTYFAFEPVSHMNDAINRMEVPDHGLAILEPGASLGGTARFTIVAPSGG